MKKSRCALPGICAALGMLVLILDSRTALEGAAQGIDLCIRSVIPALFPFFVLSAVFTGTFIGTNASMFRPLGRLCGIPQGGESILLAGLLGGYPIGAQCIGQAYAAGSLSKADARRMLGFCSNAGPAFLFGMSGTLFQNKSIPLILWAIHIVSALITGAILPHKSYGCIQLADRKASLGGQAVQAAIRSSATVCGWVILFRMVLHFSERWFFWALPQQLQIIFTGMLELTNGYVDLALLEDERLRFILASIFLGFGGFCVILQTISITRQAGLDMGYYFHGKLLQTAVSAVISCLVSVSLFHEDLQSIHLGIVAGILGVVISYILLINRKNSSSILKPSGV